MAGIELSSSSLSADANLQGYWKFSTGASTTDSSGNSKTLTESGSPTNTASGKFDYGLDLEASSSQYTYIDDGLGIGSGNVTINCWINPETVTRNDTERIGIVAIWDNTSKVEYRLGIGATGLFSARHAPNIAWNATSQYAMTVGVWYMATLTYDGTNIKLYVDGTLYSSATVSSTGSGTATTGVRIGRGASPTSNTFYYDGYIDDVAIFDRALTASEISELYYDSPQNGNWSVPYEIQSDNTKVSGSSNHTDIPLLIKDGNLSSSVYAGLQGGEINTNFISGLSETKGYWRFESGALTTDTQGNHTLTNNGTCTETTGVFGGAVNCDGDAGKYMSASSSADFSFAGDFTIGIRYKSDTDKNYSGALNCLAYNSGSYNGWTLGCDYVGAGNQPARFNYYITSTSTTIGLIGSSDINDGAWHNLMVRRIGSTVQLFVDGVSEASTTYSSAINGSGALTIGRLWNDLASGGLDGSFDEAFIINGYGLSNNDLWYWENGGSDLRITTDSAGTTEIPFEIVSLDTSAETAEIWAKVPTLSYNSNTSLFIWYGNASAVAYDASAPFGAYSVWTNYDRVHHFDTLVTDYSGNGKTLTNNGGVAQDTSSKINNGTDYGTSNSSKYFTYTTMPATGSTGFTVQFWINTAQTTGGNAYSVGWDNGSAHSFQFILNNVEANKLRAYWSGGLYSLYATTTMNDEAWHLVTYTYAGGTNGAMALYIDGGLEDSTTGTGGLDAQGTGTAEFIGRRSASAVDYLSAKTDELRTIYNGTNPSADWIATEYNNQNAPSTFWIPGRRIFVIG